MSYAPLLTTLKALPAERRARLVVRSIPFGEIIENDTRIVHGVVAKIEGGPERRIVYPDKERIIFAGNDWDFLAYGLCAAAKGDTHYEDALREAGFL